MTLLRRHSMIGGGAIPPNGLLNDLVSYWKLDESSGDALDAHGANDGTVSGATQGASGKIGDAYSFDGGDYISVDDADNLSFGDGSNDEPISVSFWVYFDAVTGVFVNKSSEYQMFISGSQFFVRFHDASTGGFIGPKINPQPFSIEEWYHVALVYNGDGSPANALIYVNNVEQSTGTTNFGAYVAMENTGNNLLLGQNFQGVLDEIGIWNRALTVDDVALLYNAGAGLSYNNFTL